MNELAIRVENLVKRYKKAAANAVDDISPHSGSHRAQRKQRP